MAEVVTFVCSSLVWILLCFTFVRSHPQCLDFRPPFNSTVHLVFCPHYSEHGCCTINDDVTLKREYYGVQRHVSEHMWAQCAGYVRQIMCLKCSPYAAHIFDGEATMSPRSFPGLCSSYSHKFYDICREVIPHMVSVDSPLNAALYSKMSFTDFVALSDVDYCYPDVTNNPRLNVRISPEQISTEGCMCVEPFATGLRNPLWAQHAGDGSDRLFIAEQVGVVHIYFPNNRTRLSESFLDIQELVYTSAHVGDERGFLGMAFHPKFKENNLFYVYYSILDQDASELSRLSEFSVLNDQNNRADHNSERVLLEIEQPYWNHNGGELLFGDDGYIYLFVGDGGSAGDPAGNSQNKSTLLGKILRIDVDGRTDGLPYAIPPDNPFIDEEGALPEIFATGVRNIWRCGKDSGDHGTNYGKGRIVCGDVGQNKYEEIDIVKMGANYGWNPREGYECFVEETCGNIGPEELPIFVYNHTVGKSITGGHVYRGCASPNLYGLYIYGDFFNGRLFRLKENITSGTWENKEIFMCGPDICLNGLVGQYPAKILSFGEDEQGEIYMLSTDKESPTSPTGGVYRLVDPVRRGNPETCQSANRVVTSQAVPVSTESVTTQGSSLAEPTTVHVNQPNAAERLFGAILPVLLLSFTIIVLFILNN